MKFTLAWLKDAGGSHELADLARLIPSPACGGGLGRGL